MFIIYQTWIMTIYFHCVTILLLEWYHTRLQIGVQVIAVWPEEEYLQIEDYYIIINHIKMEPRGQRAQKLYSFEWYLGV